MNRAAALTKRETQIMRRRGSRTNAWWRMIRARKLRNEGLTLQNIAEIMDCTHTTIIYYLKKYNDYYQYDKEFRDMVRIFEENHNVLTSSPVILNANKVVEICRNELGVDTQSKFWKIMNQLGIIL